MPRKLGDMVLSRPRTKKTIIEEEYVPVEEEYSAPVRSRTQQPKKSIRKTKAVFTGIILLIVILGGGAFYLARQYFGEKGNPFKISDDEVARLIEDVGKHILLPTSEQPTLATVVSLENLKNQPFFDHASVGDKILIYNTVKKAYLYNPTRDLVMEVGLVGDSPQLSNQSNPPSPQATSTSTTTVTSPKIPPNSPTTNAEVESE